MINPGRTIPLSLDVYAGIGNFLFSSTRYEFIEGDTLSQNHVARVSEFLYMIGSGISYDLNNYFLISMDISLKQCQNDRVDLTVKAADFDYYTYLNLTKMLETSVAWFSQNAVTWDKDEEGMMDDIRQVFEIHQALNEGTQFPYHVE